MLIIATNLLQVQEVFLLDKFACVHAFESEELAFYFCSGGVAGEGVVCSYHTVAGDDYGNGVVPYCTAYGLGGQ